VVLNELTAAPAAAAAADDASITIRCGTALQDAQEPLRARGRTAPQQQEQHNMLHSHHRWQWEWNTV
jgi:hypothetical protein